MTFTRVSPMTVGDGFTTGAPPKGIMVDASGINSKQTANLTFSDRYDNQFILVFSGPIGNRDEVKAFFPIQIKSFDSFVTSGGTINVYVLY